jgi:hypothetical protein
MLNDIVEEHLDNAAFFAEQRLLAVGGADASKDNSTSAERLQMHFESLEESGSVAWELMQARLPGARRGDYEVAVHLATLRGRDSWLAELKTHFPNGYPKPSKVDEATEEIATTE